MKKFNFFLALFVSFISTAEGQCDINFFSNRDVCKCVSLEKLRCTFDNREDCDESLLFSESAEIHQVKEVVVRGTDHTVCPDFLGWILSFRYGRIIFTDMPCPSGLRDCQ